MPVTEWRWEMTALTFGRSRAVWTNGLLVEDFY